MVSEVVVGIFAGVGFIHCIELACKSVSSWYQNKKSRIVQARALEELVKDCYIFKQNGVYKTRAGNEIKPL